MASPACNSTGTSASWLGDAQSLVALEFVWKPWRAAGQAKLDIAWKSCYRSEFDATSADDTSVAVAGAETSWKKRYADEAASIATGWLAAFVPRA